VPPKSVIAISTPFLMPEIAFQKDKPKRPAGGLTAFSLQPSAFILIIKVSMSLAPGTRLAQYEILSSLGAGGMGEVYRARDERLQRDVAIKVMAPHIASDPDMRRRFEVEARAVAALSHPAIMSIHELAIVDGFPMAVMELLEGETLRARMKRGPLAWRETVEIGATVADGLEAAHARGVIHRDLKPENVFVTRAGIVKVLDFGLALHRLDPAAPTAEVAAVTRTSPGTILGTLGYMSPEQVRGERVDGRADIFALGCILYEMLAGRPLFGGATPQEVLANVLHDSLPELTAFDPLAPPELRAIVSRMVERDRERRFQSAGDVAMALRSLLTGSLGRAAPGRRPRPRGKSLAVLPFVNAGADPQFEYITDGITESIINSLSQLGDLRVVPRSLVFRYKGLQVDPATVGLALNARTILTGRVAQQGDVLNIQAELVDTANEAQLWGERFHQKVSDLVTVQEEIAWQISEALRLRLTGAQKKKLRKRPTVNAEAHREYLRGRFHWNNWSPDAFRRALEHFERAIALDPAYGLAYAGLGDALGAMSYYGHIPPEDGFPRARAAATRAVELDPDLAEPHVTHATALMFWEWDWPGAGRELQQALRLDPKLPLAHAVHALYLITTSRLEDALSEALLARDLDPLSVFNNMAVAWVHHFAGDHEKAAQEAVRTREIVPGLGEAGNILISSYEALGRLEEAATLMTTQPAWGIPIDGGALLEALRAGGPQAYWEARRRLIETSPAADTPAVEFPLMLVHARQGNLEQALHHAERMVEAHVGGAVFLGVDPCLRPLHGHPRYEALVRRVGIPRHTASAPRTASR
jgi:eukaryotic-like serine/threonine-protein kinase